ncbi:MAG: hypothetical protein KKC71_00335 [Chloroflexi bacterium]|nr:hypothetical protein [Chloroflexota bacterium]
MKATISFRALAVTLLIALVVSYLLCIAGDLLFGWTMYQAWAPLLPGFTWPLTAGGFLIGLLWLVGYSLYAAALIALPYNFLIGSRADPTASR